MDNKKVLELAQKNKTRGKEYENKEAIRGNLLAFLTALLVGGCLFLVELFIRGSVNIGLFATVMTATGVQSLYEGIKLKRYHLTIIGIVQMLLAFSFTCLSIAQVVLI